MAAKPPLRRHPRIISIVGTRPEAIKMAPLAREIAARGRFEHQLVLTGQHPGLARHFGGLAENAVRELPYDPRGRTAARLRETLHALLCGHFRRETIDLVLVQGDTASALAGALAAHDCGIAVGHVEAGLRSHDLKQPWPEEGNRVVIDALATLLFAPTEAAAEHLRREWRVKGRIFVTGNTGIDALLHARRGARPAAATPRKIIFATCHRKENMGEPLRNVCSALRQLVETLPVDIVFPLHPNRHVRAEVEALIGQTPHIRLVEPMEHEESVALIERCWLILSDSGGLQEEGPALGKPVLVLRNVTERAEAVGTANIELVGTEPDRILAAVAALIADPERYAIMARPAFPFGDGRAAPRIVDAIETWLKQRTAAAA